MDWTLALSSFFKTLFSSTAHHHHHHQADPLKYIHLPLYALYLQPFFLVLPQLHKTNLNLARFAKTFN